MEHFLSTDAVQQHFQAALAELPYPVSQPPGDAEAQTWITFQEISATAQTASNTWMRVRHMVQVHAWTHGEDDEHRTAFFHALQLLREAGVRVYSWGIDETEKDTGIHHIACTCVWNQRPEGYEDEEEE